MTIYFIQEPRLKFKVFLSLFFLKLLKIEISSGKLEPSVELSSNKYFKNETSTQHNKFAKVIAKKSNFMIIWQKSTLAFKASQ